jgi:hypothetical protein
VNIRTPIITAAATLALAAPAMANAGVLYGPGGQSHSLKPAASVQKTRAGLAAEKGHGARGPKAPVTVSKQPLYPVIYIHVTETYPVGAVQADQCQATGDDCTPEQACDLWGAGCETLTTDDPSAAAPAGGPASSQS